MIVSVKTIEQVHTLQKSQLHNDVICTIFFLMSQVYCMLHCLRSLRLRFPLPTTTL